MNEKKQSVVVQKSQRADRFLMEFLQKLNPEFSMRGVRRLLDQGAVFCNGKKLYIASFELKKGQSVDVYLPAKAYHNQNSGEEKGARSVMLGLKDILFEDEDLLVINKPPGVLSQGTRGEKNRHVVPLLGEMRKDLKELFLCHRLDLETSGVLCLAKNEAMTTRVMEAFKRREVEKIYHALVWGTKKDGEWSVSLPLSKPGLQDGIVRVVRAGGRSAVTHFRILKVSNKCPVSLVECRPKTGRTHQIRVHLQASGLPILGDKKYMNEQVKEPVQQLAQSHHLLHAQMLNLGPSVFSSTSWEAPYPTNFKRILEQLF